MANRKPLFRAHVDQCMTGLKDPVNFKPYKKGAALDTNSQMFSELLAVKCQHAPGEHQPIEGSVFC